MEDSQSRRGALMIPQRLWNFLPDRAAFEVLARVLESAVQYGSLTLIDPWGGRHAFGTGEAPHATVRLTEPGEPARLLGNPCLRVGEAYMDGTLVIEQGTLRDFMLIGVSAASRLTEQTRSLSEFAVPMPKLKRQNPIARARANAAHHYDISGDLYRLFLDEDLQYSCAYFQNGDESLEQAQAKKKCHLAAKLRAQPGDRILDIGSGWGGLALELGRRHGVEVDGLTLSREQLEVSKRRAAEEGLQHRVRFHLRDYRQEVGTYDRIVSVGMFEHVGTPHYAEFFGIVERLLAPNGIAVIHAIGCKDLGAESNPWIEKYIFPGGYCPRLSEVFTAIEKTGLWVTDVEILRLHYAETLRHWSERFQEGRERAVLLYDERFCRMWEFYLACCEAGFRVGSLMVFQIQLARKVGTVPLTRDYISDEARQRSLR
jgi:cyclopropane-fatty-acyl-phospholipid synthase